MQHAVDPVPKDISALRARRSRFLAGRAQTFAWRAPQLPPSPLLAALRPRAISALRCAAAARDDRPGSRFAPWAPTALATGRRGPVPGASSVALSASPLPTAAAPALPAFTALPEVSAPPSSRAATRGLPKNRRLRSAPMAQETQPRRGSDFTPSERVTRGRMAWAGTEVTWRRWPSRSTCPRARRPRSGGGRRSSRASPRRWPSSPGASRGSRACP
mmetsp:Transcript_55800/g.126809  ORF Transcript_55800/g.126809 Transcript_55800/m.126809 type:complete len:217 (+) Transcript_55800:312-962(+)